MLIELLDLALRGSGNAADVSDEDTGSIFRVGPKYGDSMYL
jgi:hypothetical protein